MTVDERTLKNLYQTYLGREPGAAAEGWLNMPKEQVVQGILKSPEYTDRVPGLVESYYTDLLNRPSEGGAGVGEGEAWRENLLSGEITPAQAKQGFLDSPEYANLQTTGTTGTTTGATDPTFDVPKDVFPRSSTQIDWDANPAMGKLMDKLVASIDSMDDDLVKFSNIASERWKNLLRESISDPQLLQGTMNELASRNVLDSSVASDAISKVISDLVRGVADKEFQTQQDIAKGRIAMPERIAELAGLGKVSETTDELAPYRLMTDIILNS